MSVARPCMCFDVAESPTFAYTHTLQEAFGTPWSTYIYAIGLHIALERLKIRETIFLEDQFDIEREVAGRTRLSESLKKRSFLPFMPIAHEQSSLAFRNIYAILSLTKRETTKSIVENSIWLFFFRAFSESAKIQPDSSEGFRPYRRMSRRCRSAR